MLKGTIIIVECISSSVNYVKDIYDEGYEPVLLEPYCKGFVRSYMRKFHDHELNDMLEDEIKRPRIIMAKKSYEETLKDIKKLEPKAIIPGSDKGIELATKLAYDLGLPGNDPINLPKMRNKYICQNALKEAGIRFIDTRMVSTYDEALDFFNEMSKKGKAVVVKPASGISSLGVFVCKTENELKKAFQSNKNNPIYTMHNGNLNKVMIQECIEGVEYIVNSVSFNGNHKITRIAKYEKLTIPGKGRIYDYDRPIKSNDKLAYELSEYQVRVLSAIGIKYGAVHSEIMVDEEGPVLIEANCRLCGGNVKSEWLLKASGLSESKLSLQSYLYPNNDNRYKDLILYSDNKMFATKVLRITKSTYVTKMHLDKIVKELPSFTYLRIRKEKGFVSETINLSTGLATVYLICNSEEEVDWSLNFLKDLEDNHPEKMYSCVDIPIICKLAAKLMA